MHLITFYPALCLNFVRGLFAWYQSVAGVEFEFVNEMTSGT